MAVSRIGVRPSIASICSIGAALVTLSHGTAPAAASSAAEERLETIGQHGGTSEAVAVSGPTSFRGIGPRLLVQSVANPASPVTLSSLLLDDVIEDIVVNGSLLYVALSEAGIVAVNVANPSAPTVVHAIDTEHAYDLDLVGTSLYVADGPSLRIFDVSTPSTPVQVGSLATEAYTVRGTGTWAYVGDWEELKVCSVPSPGAISLLTTLPVWGYPVCDIAGATLVVVDGISVRRYSLAAPGSPVLLGQTTDTAAETVRLSGTIAYVAGSKQLRAYSLAAPGAPVLVGSKDFGAPYTYDQAIAISGSYAYLAFGTSVHHVLISSPATMTELYSSANVAAANGGVVIGDHLLVGADDFGLASIDLSTPASPTLVGTVPTIPNCVDVAASGSVAAAATEGTVTMLNVANPAAPSVLGATGLPGAPYIYDLEILGSRVLAATVSGPRIIDITNPASPSQVGSWTNGTSCFGIDGEGSKVYCATSNGLQIFSLAANGTILPAGALVLPSPAFAVDVVGTVAYLTVKDVGLMIVDVTTPSTPVTLSTITVPPEMGWTGWPGAVRVHDTRALVGFGWEGYAIVDVSSPSRPQLIGMLPVREYAYDVLSADPDRLVVSDFEAGLLIARWCQPFDLNCDGAVDGADLAIILGAWGGAGETDLNDDGTTDGADLALVLGAWGT